MAAIGTLTRLAMEVHLRMTNCRCGGVGKTSRRTHIPVLLDQNEFEKALPKIVDSLEEPVAASSIVPMYFVCQRARRM